MGVATRAQTERQRVPSVVIRGIDAAARLEQRLQRGEVSLGCKVAQLRCRLVIVIPERRLVPEERRLRTNVDRTFEGTCRIDARDTTTFIASHQRSSYSHTISHSGSSLVAVYSCCSSNCRDTAGAVAAKTPRIARWRC